MRLNINEHLIVIEAKPIQLALIRDLCARKDLSCYITPSYQFMFIAGSKKELYNMLLEILIYYPIEHIDTRMAPLNYEEIDENEVTL